MSKKARNEILRVLVDRVPNYVPESVLRSRLRAIGVDELAAALSELQTEGLIERQDDPRLITGLPERFFRLKTRTGLPVRTSIQIGDIQLPRLLSDSSASLFPEVFNEALERLSEYATGLEKRFQELVRSQERRYWANVAALFAVFVSLLALVLVGLPKITTDPNLPFWDTVRLNLAQVLPIAVVLGVFILVLRWVLK